MPSRSYEALFSSGGFILLVIACIYFSHGSVIIYSASSEFMNTPSLFCLYSGATSLQYNRYRYFPP